MSILILLRKSILKSLNITQHCQRIGNRQSNFHFTRATFKLKTTCEDGPVFTTRLALPPDYENVADFMCEYYYPGEPAVRNIHCAPATAPPIWRQAMLDQVRRGLSLIAENRDHCVIGAVLNTVMGPGDEEAYDEEYANKSDSPAIKEIFHYFGYIAHEPKIFERFCVPRMFEISSLAVNPEYRGLGIAKRLVAESWYLARDCDYPMFHVCCTSRQCINICNGFGWQEVWNMPFDQYVRNGEVIFQNIQEPHTVCRVFIDWLVECKPYCTTSKKCTKVTSPPKIS